ncbi:MAG: hypothetical protein DMG40_04110 [Acidobacteria bacterium]|nr:MAG: hypothetical protein DMG40_04110 [Acidobacteriota bacterium]
MAATFLGERWPISTFARQSCQPISPPCREDLPQPAAAQGSSGCQDCRPGLAQTSGATSFEKIDFLQTQPLRRPVHAREGGCCFYCLRRFIHERRCIDHVAPLAKLGTNSYRNLVSCCLDCNSLKANRDAVE